jgi:IS30 family transposase
MIGRPPLPRPVQTAFWDAIRVGRSIPAACHAAGIGLATGPRWFRQAGGVIGNAPRPLSDRYLCLAEREEISRGLAGGHSIRRIGRDLDRPASTISREVTRNGGPAGYRAIAADRAARLRARRPKTAKLVDRPELRELVQGALAMRWSPEQISMVLRHEYPDRPELQVSTETIYQSIYVQGRGALRRELAACLRTGRALRKPRSHGRARRSRIPGLVPIADRPPEADDRRTPGHREGDLITGTANRSAIGTLVERTTRFVILLHLPGAHDAVSVRDAMVEAVESLPARLKRSMTWDRGAEMAGHVEFTMATDMPVYFCDPRSPWQRGTNENTNGLLRQYLPKGTDLSVHGTDELEAIADELNARPRKTLGWLTPAQSLARVLSGKPAVATTS